jgi:hypothetical protein
VMVGHVAGKGADRPDVEILREMAAAVAGV